MIVIKNFILEPLSVNCYIAYDPQLLEGVIIDAGGGTDIILEYITSNRIYVKAIIATHGHYDHVIGVPRLKEHLNLDFYMHKEDLDFIRHGTFNFIISQRIPEPDKLLEGGEKIGFGEEVFEVLHLPGHSPGSIGLYSENNKILISGDLIFKGSIGRTDLPGGSWDQMKKSIKLIMNLPDDIIIYPGHGPTTTVGFERINNPFVRAALEGAEELYF